MTPEEFDAIRRNNDAIIRRIEKITDAAQSSAFDAKMPLVDRLRPVTHSDILARKVLWYPDDGSWAIPAEEPHPGKFSFTDIEGCRMDIAGAFVEITPS